MNLLIKTPPGPAQDHHILDIRRNALAFIMELVQTYGDIVRYTVDGWTATLVNHPRLIKHVLQDNHRNYSKEGTPDFMMLRPMLGEGILTSEGESWLRQRRMAQPAFHRQRIEMFGTLMTDATLTMLDEWRNTHILTGEPIDVVTEMTRLTLVIVAKALFGYDVTDTADEFGRAVDDLNQCIGHYDPADMEVYRKFPNAIRTIRQTVQQIIVQRRLEGEDKGDFLSMLLTARDEETGSEMNDQQIRDQIVTLLLAGHETTAKVLSWTLYLLSQHPNVMQTLHNELSIVLGGCVPTIDDLPRLPYTWMVIEESMRLYPPIWIISRVVVHDDEVDGFHIPAGSMVAISPYAMHRHPDFWDEPERFDPGRFWPERSAERPPFTYFPFSGGPRLCLGKHFATTEAHLVLATITRLYRPQLIDNHPVEPEALVTLRPRYGLPIHMHPI